MGNRFDTIFNREQYVPLVQPVPADMLYGLGKGMKEENDADIEASLKMNDFWKTIKTARFDAAEKARLDPMIAGIINPAMEAAVKGDPKAHSMILQAQNTINNMPELQMLQHNFTQEQLRDKEVAEMKKTQSYQDFLDPYNQFAQERQTGQRGLERYDYTGVKGYTHPVEDGKKMVANIAATQLLGEGEWFSTENVNGKPTLLIRGSKGTRGVTPEMLETVVDFAVDPFLDQTKGGDSFKDQQLMQELRQIPAGQNNPAYIQYAGSSVNPNDPNSLNTVNGLLREQAKKFLFSLGVPQLHEIGGGNTIQTTPKYMSKEEAPATSLGLGDARTIGQGLKRAGNLKLPSTAGLGGAPVRTYTGSTGGFSAWASSTEDNPGNNKEAIVNYKPRNFVEARYLEKANKALGRDHRSGEQAIQTMKDYEEAFYNNLTYDIYNLNTDAKDVRDINSLLFKARQIFQQGTIVPQDDPSNPMTGKQFMETYGSKDPKVASELQVINPYGIPKASVITTSDGKEFYINNTLADKVSPQQATMSDWGRAVYSPSPVEVVIPTQTGVDPKTKKPVIKNERVYIEFEHDSNPTLTDKGNIGFLDTGVAKIYNSGGKLLGQSSNTNSAAAIQELYTKVATNQLK